MRLRPVLTCTAFAVMAALISACGATPEPELSQPQAAAPVVAAQAQKMCGQIRAETPQGLVGTAAYSGQIDTAADALGLSWGEFETATKAACPEEYKDAVKAQAARVQELNAADQNAAAEADAAAAARRLIEAQVAADMEAEQRTHQPQGAEEPVADTQAARCQYLADWLDQGQGWSEGPHSGQLAPEWVAHEFYDDCT